MNEKPPEKKAAPPATREYSEALIDPHLLRAPAMAIWIDQPLLDRAKNIALYLSKAEGFVPPHLLGKTESCFAVVERALAWNLSPFAVANCCYQTPNGRVGFEGKLCQAAIENSGKLEGGVKFIHIGDWTKVAGKFEIRTSTKSGREYAVPTWSRDEAREWGLGVIVSAKLKGEEEPRTWELNLAQCFPLNSTLWATDPKTQICYTAVRRFASLAMPGLFMGMDFDRESSDEDSEMVRAARAKDITPPAPTREDFKQTTVDPAAGAGTAPQRAGTEEEAAPIGPSTGDENLTASGQESEEPTRVNVTEGGTWYAVLASTGIEFTSEDPVAFVDEILNEAMRVMKKVKDLNALWDANSAQFQFLPEAMGQRIRDQWPRVKKSGNPNQDNLV